MRKRLVRMLRVLPLQSVGVSAMNAEDVPEDDSVCTYCGYPDCRCDDPDDDDDELDEIDDDMYDCHGWFDGHGKSAVFMCGAVGSEDCDECPCYRWLGLTNKQIDELELSYDDPA